jgi:hypothetical protein
MRHWATDVVNLMREGGHSSLRVISRERERNNTVAGNRWGVTAEQQWERDPAPRDLVYVFLKGSAAV